MRSSLLESARWGRAPEKKRTLSIIFHQYKDISGDGLRVSNASQSPVPIGNKPIELHLYSPNASVSMLARIYTIFWRKRVLNDLEEEDDGAKGANAVLIAATFLNGLNISMNTIPMLKI